MHEMPSPIKPNLHLHCAPLHSAFSSHIVLFVPQSSHMRLKSLHARYEPNLFHLHAACKPVSNVVLIANTGIKCRLTSCKLMAFRGQCFAEILFLISNNIACDVLRRRRVIANIRDSRSYRDSMFGRGHNPPRRRACCRCCYLLGFNELLQCPWRCRVLFKTWSHFADISLIRRRRGSRHLGAH